MSARDCATCAPGADCDGCTIDRLRAERDEARGAAVPNVQLFRAITEARDRLAETERERDAARADAAEWGEFSTTARAEVERLRAALRAIVEARYDEYRGAVANARALLADNAPDEACDHGCTDDEAHPACPVCAPKGGDAA